MREVRDPRGQALLPVLARLAALTDENDEMRSYFIATGGAPRLTQLTESTYPPLKSAPCNTAHPWRPLTTKPVSVTSSCTQIPPPRRKFFGFSVSPFSHILPRSALHISRLQLPAAGVARKLCIVMQH